MSSESEIEFIVNYCNIIAAIITDCNGREKIAPIKLNDRVYILELPENIFSIVGDGNKDPFAISPDDIAVIYWNIRKYRRSEESDALT